MKNCSLGMQQPQPRSAVLGPSPCQLFLRGGREALAHTRAGFPKWDPSSRAKKGRSSTVACHPEYCLMSELAATALQ